LDAIENLRSALSDPNIAYVLLIISILGISVEVFTPGFFVGGTTSIIAGLLAFLALSTLSINPFGLILLIISLAFFIGEAFLKTKWLLATLGMASLILGSVFLFYGGSESRASPYLIAVLSAIVSAVLVYLVNRATTAQKRRIAIGSETVVGDFAIARTELNPNGMVLYQGELWQAELIQGQATRDEQLVITGMKGLKLYVTHKEGVNK